MSIFSELSTMKSLADEILGKKPYAPYGYCETCGTELEYESPFHGAMDQPPSTGGYWCSECGEWS